MHVYTSYKQTSLLENMNSGTFIFIYVFMFSFRCALLGQSLTEGLLAQGQVMLNNILIPKDTIKQH